MDTFLFLRSDISSVVSQVELKFTKKKKCNTWEEITNIICFLVCCLLTSRVCHKENHFWNLLLLLERLRLKGSRSSGLGVFLAIGTPEFKSRYDHWLELFFDVPVLTSRFLSEIADWSTLQPVGIMKELCVCINGPY